MNLLCILNIICTCMSLRQYNLSVNISIVPPPPFPPLHMHGITMSFNYIQKTKQNGYLVIKRTHYVSRGFSSCRCVITHLVCLQCSHLTPHSGSFHVNYAHVLESGDRFLSSTAARQYHRMLKYGVSFFYLIFFLNWKASVMFI